MRPFCHYSISVLLALLPSLVKAQTFAWSKRIGGSGASVATPNWDRGISLDGSDNIYLLSEFSGTADFDPGTNVLNLNAGNGAYVVQKFNASGNLVWTRQFAQNVRSIATDVAGNMFLIGTFSGTQDFDPGPSTFTLSSLGFADIFVMKLDANGNFLWAKQVGGAYEESVGAITISGSGRVYLSGAFGNAPAGIVATADFDPDPAATHWLTSTGGNDAFVLALSSDGTFLWVHQKGTANGEAAGPIATDGNGNVIFAGSANNLFFVEKIDSDKKLMWSLDFGLPQIFSIATDPAGNILLAGGFGGTQDLDPGTGVKKFTASSVQDGFNEKLDANGSLVWATHIKANGSATSIISDASGNIYTTGHYGATGGNIDFDPGPGTFNLRTNGRAMYIQKLSGAGSFLWAGQVSGDSKSKAFSRGILVNSSNDVVTQFEFSGTVDVDPGSATVSLKAVGSQDKVLQVLRQATTTPHIVIKGTIRQRSYCQSKSLFSPFQTMAGSSFKHLRWVPGPSGLFMT